MSETKKTAKMNREAFVAGMRQLGWTEESQGDELIFRNHTRIAEQFVQSLPDADRVLVSDSGRGGLWSFRDALRWAKAMTR